MTTPDNEDWLAAARPAERTVQLCLRGDLVAEYEELERQLEAARKHQSDSLAAGSDVVVLAQQIEQLRERMSAATKTFRLRALPRRQWRQLVAAHPPRRGEDGKVLDSDAIGVNSDSYFEAIVRACTVEPELTEAQWTRLLDEVLSDRQFDTLSDTAWGLNRRDVEVPFSRAASRILANSGGESRQPSGSASPSSDSTAGSPGPSPSTSETQTDE